MSGKVYGRVPPVWPGVIVPGARVKVLDSAVNGDCFVDLMTECVGRVCMVVRVKTNISNRGFDPRGCRECLSVAACVTIETHDGYRWTIPSQHLRLVGKGEDA